MHKEMFTFEGKQRNGTRVRGTIEAESIDHAFERLTTEYELTVRTVSKAAMTSPLFLPSATVFASWLLGWCGLALAVSFYDATRALPFSLPAIRALTDSSLLLNTTLALFLVLLGIRLWELVEKKRWATILLYTLGIATFLLLKF